MDDVLARITKMIADPHPLPGSERPSRWQTVVGVVGPFIVLVAVIGRLALLG